MGFRIGLGRQLFIAALLILLTSQSAFAADPSVSDSMALTVQRLYESMFAPLTAFKNSLAGNGSRLIFALLVLHVVAGGVMWAAGTTDLFDLFLRGFKLSIVAGLAFSAVEPQAWLGAMTGAGHPVTLPDSIMTGMGMLMNKAAHTGGGFTDAIDLSSDGGGKLFTAVLGSIWNGLNQILSISFFDDLNWWESLKTAVNPAMWLSLLYWVGTVFMYLLASGVLLMELVGAELTIRFALAFTPLMVPWLLFRPMEFLFNGWLKSLILGSVAYIVALLLLAGFSRFAMTAAAQVALAKNTEWTNFNIAMTFLPVFLGSFIFFLMSSKAFNIAAGLLSGGGTDGISIDTFRRSMQAAGAASATPGQASKEIGGRGQNAATAAYRGGKDVAGKLSTGKAAYQNAKAGGASTSQALRSANSAMNSSPGAGLKQSVGGRAVDNMAQNEGKMLTPQQFTAAATRANAAFAEGRANGKSNGEAREMAIKAAGNTMKGFTKSSATSGLLGPKNTIASAPTPAPPFPTLK